MDKLDKYILIGKTVVPCDLMTWAAFMEHCHRHVAQETIGEYHISTVFLGMDHRFGGRAGPPVVYETMVFGPVTDNEMLRAATYNQAIANHREIVDWVRELVEESALAINRAAGATADK